MQRPVNNDYDAPYINYSEDLENRVEAGSTTSIVTLRVVGGDEKEVSNMRQ
jgi:hypothetical protein